MRSAVSPWSTHWDCCARCRADVPRLFFALLPTRAQADALVADTAPLIAQLAGQPVPATNLHATLCFVGAVPDDQVAALCDAAARVRAEPVALTFDALDVWQRPEILCATGPSSESVRDLSVMLGDVATTTGLRPDLKPFRAHMTLARKVRRRVARQFEWPRALTPLELRCDEFVLMESRRTDAGSTYSVVRSWPLDKK